MFLHSQLPVYEFLLSICQEFDNILGRSKCASDSILRRNRPDRRNRIGSARRARGRLAPCSRSFACGEAAAVLLSSRDFGSRADIHFRKFPSKFVKISQNFQIFLQISENPSNFLAFPEIPAKFREICAEKSPIWRKFSNILATFAKNN